MRYRKLRIAWLIVWLAFGVLVAMRIQLGIRPAIDWWAVALCVLIASVAWFPWPRQFSLRTLLIVTTLVAVVMGLVVYVARK
jgi:hypothetical protein